MSESEEHARLVTERSRSLDLFSFGESMGRLRHQLPVLAAKRAGAELYGAPRLNAFQLFGPDEYRLSRIIADLFDPRGSHGQDVLFLNSLLVALALPRVGLTESITVRREVQTHTKRRIDLVIETRELIIGIENKPWAKQQDEQLADYLAALRGWAGKRRPVLVFLSGQEPETAVGDVSVLRFVAEQDEPSLHRVLADALRLIRAPRTRMHVEELIEYLVSQFGNAIMVKIDVPYIEAVEAEFEKGADSRRALALTMLAQKSLHGIILDEIATHLLVETQKFRDDFEWEYDENLSAVLSTKDDWWGLRRPSWPQNCSLAISPGKSAYGGIYFGLRAPDPQSDYVGSDEGCKGRVAVERAAVVVGGGSRSAFWPWWKYAEPRNWDATEMARIVIESPTSLPKDHPRVVEITERFLALAKAVDEAVDG